MSKDYQSASVRATANCGAEAKTPATSLPREQAQAAACLELEHVRACLRLWIGGDGEQVDLEADAAPDAFCDTLGAMFKRAEQALASIDEDLADGDLRALLVIGGAHDLLEACAIADALTPRAGHAVQALAVQAAKALLADDAAEVLQ